jgi:hypothetical protein
MQQRLDADTFFKYKKPRILANHIYSVFDLHLIRAQGFVSLIISSCIPRGCYITAKLALEKSSDNHGSMHTCVLKGECVRMRHFFAFFSLSLSRTIDGDGHSPELLVACDKSMIKWRLKLALQ